MAGFTLMLLAIGGSTFEPIQLQTAHVMVPWLLLVWIAELLPVLYLPDLTLTLSMPLLLAAGMILGPVPAGILGLLGTWDSRFHRREVS
ncbi:MAG TPA: hypothetical protein VID47_17680, partial [Actinomycetota bacterium]